MMDISSEDFSREDAIVAQRKTMNADRLMSAADHLLNAINSDAGPDATVDVYRGRSAKRAAAMRAFTPAELVEAMGMLLRMGLVERPRPGRR